MIEKKNIYQKLLEVKKQMTTIKKDKKNPFFKSNYADINMIIEQVEPILIENGLLLTQPIVDGQVFSIITDINYSDQNVSSSLALPVLTDPQKMGSAITYYRRYTLVSLLGLMTEDDDGNTASGNTKKTETPFKASSATPAKPWLNVGKGNWDAIVLDITKADKVKGTEIFTKVKAKYQMGAETIKTLEKLIK